MEKEREHTEAHQRVEEERDPRRGDREPKDEAPAFPKRSRSHGRCQDQDSDLGEADPLRPVEQRPAPQEVDEHEDPDRDRDARQHRRGSERPRPVGPEHEDEAHEQEEDEGRAHPGERVRAGVVAGGEVRQPVVQEVALEPAPLAGAKRGWVGAHDAEWSQTDLWAQANSATS